MTAPGLIGLTGYAQHGKDTAAGLLVAEFGYNQYAFANQLKQMALVLNPIIPVTLWEGGAALGKPMTMRLSDLIEMGGWETAKTHEEVRRFLQVLGTEAVRDLLGEDSWVDALYRKATTEGRTGPGYGTWNSVVISDVRFPNEDSFIHDEAGEVWKIVRVNADGSPFDNGVGLSHPSEQLIGTLDFDRVITASTVEELQQCVRGVMRELREA